MKNVLFIDYFFPPLLGDWRGIGFAEHLPEFGWRPIVISAAAAVTYDKDYGALRDIPQSLRVSRVNHKEPSFAWQYFRRALKIGVDFPDYYKTWYHPAYNEARRILREEQIQLIYSASPTFTTAFVAMELKRRFSIPWVADFLDGWAVNDFLNQEYDQSLIEPLRWFQKRRVRNAERAILEYADRVVVIHDHVKQRWRELHGIDDPKICVVTDGYDESVFKGARPRLLYDDRPTIAFLGSYYSAFGEEIAKFVDAVNEVEKDAELIFIGRSAGPVHNMNLKNTTCMLHIPRRSAIEFALGADFLFLVMPPHAKWTPSKLYDYLRVGKPILALVPPDGDAARIVRDSNAGFILDFDGVRMRNQLAVIFQKWKQGGFKRFRPSPEYVARFERRKLTEQMVRAFNEVSLA